MKPIARIDDWIIAHNRLIGSISEHTHQPTFFCKWQVTSPIVRMPGLGIVETENTIYILGTARRLPL